MDYSKSALFEEIEFSDADNVLLMSLMEETQEDEFNGDDRLASIIRSLEEEITNPELNQLEYMDSDNCWAPVSDDFNWVDMEVASSSSFDEMDSMVVEYGIENAIDDFSRIYCGVFFEQQHLESYLPQDQNDVVF